MVTLNDLVAQATPIGDPEAGPPATVDTLAVPEDVAADRLLDALTEYFGEDDSRRRVRLVVGEREVGYLKRTALYAFAATSVKSIGAGDYGTLPGEPDFRLIRLRCPRDGCARHLLVTYFDEDAPPRCVDHPDAEMEIA